MKSLVTIWLLVIHLFPGICIFSFNKNENNRDKKSDSPTIGLYTIPSSQGVDLINLESVNNSSSGLEMKYHCAVTEGVPLPRDWARGGHAGGIIKGNVIVAGGTNWSKDKTTKYWLKNSAAFKNGKWRKGSDLPKPMAYSMNGYNDDGFYVAGGTSDGKSFLNDAYMLNSLNEKAEWKILPQLPEAVAYGAGVVINDKFFVTCGSLENEQTNRMWSLDTNHLENGWTECDPVPGVGRMFPAFVACGKYLYLIGGLKGFSPLEPLNELYRYNPGENEWERLKDLPLKGYAWVGQPVDDNHLLLTGRADGIIHDCIWVVDLRNSSVKEVGNLVIPSATAPLVKISDECFWLIAGEPDSNKNRTERVSVISLNPMK